MSLEFIRDCEALNYELLPKGEKIKSIKEVVYQSFFIKNSGEDMLQVIEERTIRVRRSRNREVFTYINSIYDEKSVSREEKHSLFLINSGECNMIKFIW